MVDPGVDPQTGLQYLRARYYDPGTAQFLTRDPLAQLTRQPYAYAGDNPLNGADPTGLDCGLLDPGGCINDAAGFIFNNSGAISAVTGGLALFGGPAAPILGVVSTITAGVAAIHDFVNGNPVAGALDAAGAAFGAGSLYRYFEGLAIRSGDEAAARAALAAADAAAQTNIALASTLPLAAELRALRLLRTGYEGSATSFALDALGLGLEGTIDNAIAANCGVA